MLYKNENAEELPKNNERNAVPKEHWNPAVTRSRRICASGRGIETKAAAVPPSPELHQAFLTASRVLVSSASVFFFGTVFFLASRSLQPCLFSLEPLL